MANNKSTYAINAVLNALLRNTALQIATPYISLHSADPGLTGANEITGNAYARILASFAAASGSTSNSAAVIFVAPTPSIWSPLLYAGIWDAITSGNFLYKIPLNFAVTTSVGVPVEFPIGTLVISEN